eukprot:PhM_4_TR14064/c0_g1_i1/m.9920/K18764/CCRN4L; nocturnin
MSRFHDPHFEQTNATLFIRNIPIAQMRDLDALKTALRAAFSNKLLGVKVVGAVDGDRCCGFVTLDSEATAKHYLASSQPYVTVAGQKCGLGLPKSRENSPVPSNTPTLPNNNMKDQRQQQGESRPPLPSWQEDTSPLVVREMVTLVPSDVTDTTMTHFSAVTWNTLFPRFTDMFVDYCPVPYLNWGHRFPRVLSCLRQLDGDIVALQEVGGGDEFDSLYTALEAAGYSSEAVLKCVRNGANKPPPDGVCVAWRRSMFEVCGEPILEQLLAENSQVCATVVLRHRASGRHIVVTTAHLMAQKMMETGRRRQVTAALSISRRAAAVNVPDGTAVDYIFLGDLNSEPRWGVVPAMLAGELDPEIGPFLEPHISNISAAFTDKQFTCMMPHTQDQLDYIFHTPGLEATAVLRVPSDLAVVGTHQRDMRCIAERPTSKFEQLPTPSFPSDHLPLKCVFRLSQTKK